MAVVLGFGGAVVASLFLAVLTAAQTLIWTTIPEQLGIADQSLWYLLPWMVVGAALVAVAYRLPGHAGGSPITGLHFDIGPREIGSVVLAALGSLIFAAPLGPEAPLIACGTALGGLVARRADARGRQLAMLLAGAAAIGAIFGNPFITAFLFLEFAAAGMLPAAALVPVLVALGTGYLVMTGLGRFSGLGTHELSVPGLQVVERLEPADFLIGLLVAVLATAAILIARELGWRLFPIAAKHRVAVLLGSAVFMAIVAWGACTLTGLSLESVLFSGEGGLPELIAATSAGALAVIVVAKMVVYGTALGAGFRGGPIFPAVGIGVAVASGVALWLDPGQQSALIVCGIAAAAAATLKMPFTAGLLGLLITGTAGVVTAPVAILGAVVGWIARTALDNARPHVEGATPAE